MFRNTFAVCLRVIAVPLGFVGVTAHWVDHMDHNPEPTERLAVTAARDEKVRAVLRSSKR